MRILLRLLNNGAASFIHHFTNDNCQQIFQGKISRKVNVKLFPERLQKFLLNCSEKESCRRRFTTRNLFYSHFFFTIFSSATLIKQQIEEISGGSFGLLLSGMNSSDACYYLLKYKALAFHQEKRNKRLKSTTVWYVFTCSTSRKHNTHNSTILFTLRIYTLDDEHQRLLYRKSF